MGLLRIIKKAAGSLAVVLGSFMLLGAIVGGGSLLMDGKVEDALFGTAIVFIMCVPMILTGKRWMKNPTPEEAEIAVEPLPAPAEEEDYYEEADNSDDRVITVVLQQAAEPATRHVVHLRCRHCGTTTPESERQCGQCGAPLR